MVRVPAGEVDAPDPAAPDSRCKVQIKPFWIGKTEVTWEEYDVFAFLDKGADDSGTGADALSRPSRPYGAPDRGFGHKGFPAIGISLFGAQEYCKWLSAKTGRNYRLPTEAEWEYAARAGQAVPEGDALAEYAWFWQEKTQPVGKKKANAWGVHDALGNAAEWCSTPDGKGVLCGGAYDDMAKSVSFSARKRQTDGWTASDPQVPKGKWWLSDAPFAGFRIACDGTTPAASVQTAP